MAEIINVSIYLGLSWYSCRINFHSILDMCAVIVAISCTQVNFVIFLF